jgi:hypothetical protein
MVDVGYGVMSVDGDCVALFAREKIMTDIKRKRVSVDTMVGCVFYSVSNYGGDLIEFRGKRSFDMYHEQVCSEDVIVEDITGDLDDLVGSEILDAYESDNVGHEPDGCYSSTWTMYHFRTNKGSVCIRWFGESNGYYSEEVDLEELVECDKCEYDRCYCG